MASINTGAALGGAANARASRESRELEGRRLDIVESQFKANQDAEMLQTTRERFAGLAEQAVGIVQNIPIGRDDPRFAASIKPIRDAVASLAARAEQSFPGSVSAQSQLALFDSAITSTPTILETAEAEAEATVAGAAAQASAIKNLSPEQQTQVRDILGLGDDARTQEFFGLLEILEDPNASPLAMEKAGARMEEITSSSQLIVSADREGNITVSQGPAGAAVPQRTTMNAGQLDELRAAKDIVSRGIEITTAFTQNADTALGALGTLRSGTQTLTGIASDLTGIPFQQIASEFESLVAQLPPESREAFSVGEVDAAEGILTFAVARALQGDSNRLLAGSIERAQKMVKLTGATSEEQVRDRLSFIGQFLQSQEANFQRRLEQGTSGTATTEREPAMPQPGQEDLMNRLDSLLGESGG